MQLVDLFIVDSNILTKVLKSNDKLGEGITTILTRSLGDLYPEVKRLCSMAVRHLVANFPVLAITHGVDLMKSSVLNLGHQHAKTRQLTIQALGQLILCCAGAAGGNGVPNSSSTSALQGDLAVASSAAEADLAVMSDELAMMSDGATLLENPSNEAALATCLKDIVVPAFHKVVEDSSASVRLTLARCHGFLLRAKPLKTLGLAHLGLEAPFLTQLLVLTRDVADEVQRVSFEALQQASNHWAEHTPGWDHGSALSSELPPRALFVCSAEVLPVEEAVYSSISTCAMVASHSTHLLGPLLEATSSWTVRGRVRALDTLSCLALLCRGTESALGPDLHHIVTSVARCLCDDEDEVVAAARHCAAAIGCGVCATAAIGLSLPRARGQGEGFDTAQARTAGLMAAAAVLEGCFVSAAAQVTSAVCATLGSVGLLLQGWDSELGIMDRHLAAALLHCCNVVVKRGSEPEGCFTAQNTPGEALDVRNVLLALAYLSGIPSESVSENTAEEVTACSLQLAQSLYPNSEDPTGALYSTHFSGLLDFILSSQVTIAAFSAGGVSGSAGCVGMVGQALWENRDPSRRAFDAVLRVGAAAAGPSLDVVVPVITAHVAMDCKPDLKLSMLCLLEALLECSPSFWPRFVVDLVNTALMHNMVWKAGRVASTVRKVAIACYYSCLHRGYADRAILFKIAPPLLPVLKTDLDDYDASTRELVCLSLDLMFRALPGALSEQPVLELYPALLKRLDDSSDQVRYAVCSCFLSFLRSAPPKAFAGTTIDYTLDQLLVHLDDVDPAIQERIFKVLRITLTIDAPRVAKKAADVRSAHRSPKLIDQLIALANE
eukprot:CAMPEP_0114355972 /NCGR_PEP_ID=MMETSP0101-20121206/20625_1 /TAXON_ID=38822 ORGANISM="Pteridomonas danica, Strain PT" /NCGR_SAMPLE_ID=MMETSP0101 /ASSEMBLY_ACC=CAM_ASM_000211 /LENGTH=834 /DNA_ID=CAMNT_0001498197 /DNA_START=594 /DNA_END=3098 /DNA_ORIENTATION=-